MLLERLRIAEQHGVQYQGLTFTKDLATTTGEAGRREALMDAYDILGVSPDDPAELIKDVFRRKSMYYHPDKGGTNEKFKRLNKAYELICDSRGIK
ncbi:Chaperone protein DnaJ [subsurface metagenome]